MKNLGNMLKQAQEMQAKVEEMQRKLEELEIDGTAGAGLVTVTMSGRGHLKSVKIDPSLVDPSEIEVLEDLIVAAANDAKSKIEATLQEKTQEMMGGLSLPPGMKLPF